MNTSQGRRKPTKLSAEVKWEIFLAVAQGQVTQAEAARKHRVDVSTIIGIRRCVKDAGLAALPRKGPSSDAHGSYTDTATGSGPQSSPGRVPPAWTERGC